MTRRKIAPALWLALAWLIVATVICVASIARQAAWPSGWLLFYSSLVLLLSPATTAAFYRDKRAARLDRWRVPETTLQLMAFLGGWPGALYGQHWFRHKTQKITFRVILWTSIACHLLFFSAFCFYSLPWTPSTEARVGEVKGPDLSPE